VDSAVDTRPSTVSPSASSSKTSGENPPVKPRMNAVACEVGIIATGARSSEKGGQRELFTEETTTALVFENGGVLRLAAAVVPGQLLFLTHEETKREVVAQVTRKRDFRPMICYVEVEFSEPAPGFWGIAFSEIPALAAAPPQQTKPDESAQDAQAIFSNEPITPAPAPSAQEIAMLNEEVEALREQLKLLQAQKATGSLPAPAAIPDLSRTKDIETPRAPADVPAQIPVLADAPGEQLLRLLNAAGEVSQESPTEVSGVPAGAHATPPNASTSPPMDAAEHPFSEEDLLPKPALDFKNTKPPAKLAAKPQQRVSTDSQPSAVRKDLLFAAFVLIVAGAAWYQNLLPGLPLLKSFYSGTAPIIVAHPAAPASQKTVSASPDSGKSLPTSEIPTTPPGEAPDDASQAAASGKAKPSTLAAPGTDAEAKSAPDSAVDAAGTQEKPEVAASGAKRSAPLQLSKAALVSAAPSSDDAAIVPPKLIKSVRAIASPNTLSDFAVSNSDNVTFDALVDTSGQVKSMKALSGSPSLQSAAMAALKQYRYEPATRRGKPVPAHVTVKVKFLFEP
jgi:protein TonB